MKNTIIVFVLLGICLGSFAQKSMKNNHAGRLSVAPKQSEKYTFPRRLWVDVSIQAGMISTFGIGTGINLHYLDKQRRHFQLRYNYLKNLEFYTPPSAYGVSDIGYMIGWVRARKYSLMEIAVGISCVTGYRPGWDTKDSFYYYVTKDKLKKDPFTTIGIPFEADIKLMAEHHTGIGFVFKANLNPKASYATFGVEIALNGPN